MPVLKARPTSHSSDVDTEGSWAISYGDMITLLLTFFILFFSTDQKKERMEAMEESLLARLESHSPINEKPQPAGGQDDSVDNQLTEKLAAKVHKVGHKLIVEFPNTSFFNFGAIALTTAGRQELGKFTKLYLPYSGNYLLGLRAYTDNKKVRKGTKVRYSDNLELSALRSVAAMRVLQTLGIPLNRMRLGGYGELRLTADSLARALASTPNYNQDGLALARKVVLVIEPEPREDL